MAAAIPLAVMGVSAAVGYFQNRKKNKLIEEQNQLLANGQQQQQQPASQPKPTGTTVGGVTVPQLPSRATQDMSTATVAGQREAQRVRRSAVAAAPRRPAVPPNNALRSPVLSAGTR